MNLADLSKHTSTWFNTPGPQSEIVISSRVRLARNLAGFQFLPCLDSDRKSEILNKLTAELKGIDLDCRTSYIDIASATDLERELLVERHLISRRHANGTGPRGLVLSEDESFAAMINEEDHLRMQVYKTGLQLQQCWQRIDGIDDQLEKHLDYAFSPKYGYLTACPTNLGTGIRVSVMLHLPALKMTRQLDKFFNAARDLDLAVRGLFGEGTEATGDFFQLSNQVTLGLSEQEIVDQFATAIVPQIVAYESAAREELLRSRPAVLDDKVQRALGVLRSARLISSQEALFLLSHLRLGVNLGKLPNLSITDVNELFMLTQPAHLQLNARKTLTPDDRDVMRANIIREKLTTA
ncbi:Putative ATP:guanido phosphotransferase [Anaerohalosphaera lusitana]|uniref:Putative ATP:guanido phosphotransferase n=1 Tax=Anaerohalosphaera lusitana TaxID=1936003 RepID=A0A1U9NHT7_9BACT|nr:protein arginine kinase [Anaerohalosphaera lusitana]AQT67076.1 Putative ATP:guanido phosphotransferase [Anaerohalosphaera lusitana]